MKGLLAILSFMLITSCHSQKTDRELVTEFVNKVLMEDNFDIKKIKRFINVKEHDEKFYQLLELNIKEIHTKLRDKSMNFSIEKHNDDLIIKEYNLIHDNYDKVYYIICDNTVVTPIVLDEGDQKIIAFFTALTKKRGKNYPWLLK